MMEYDMVKHGWIHTTGKLEGFFVSGGAGVGS